MRECIVTAAALLLLATPRIVAGSTTPFRLGDQAGIIVPVTIGGRGPYLMLLDTGATHSAITEGVASAIGARAIAASTVISPTAPVIRPVVAVEDWSFGRVMIDAVLPSVVPDGSFDSASNVQGLIGQDVLAGLRYTIDFKRRVIEWHDRAPVPHGAELSLWFDRGRFLVELPHERSTVRFVPDSGAAAVVLFEQAGRVPLRVVETGDTVGLASANATFAARRVKIRELRLGDLTLHDVPAVAVPRTDLEPAEGDGLLPLHLFQRVTFDGPARRLFLG